LGRQGLVVSAIGLGCMGMSDFYGDSEESTNLAVLEHAIDIGVNFLDTADMYGVGENERLLAKVLKTRRDEVVLATKFGNVRAANGDFLGVNGSPEYVAAACDASLQRLGVDHIDLYYQHRVDRNVPIEETIGAMQRLVEAGKVRHLGMSEASADTLRRAAAVHPIAALQSEYLRTDLDMNSGSSDPTFSGWYAEASYFLTGENRGYKPTTGRFERPKVKRPFRFSEDGWGAWQVAARYSALDLSDAGVILAPANPGFYLNPTTVGEVVDFVAGKLLDLIGVKHTMDTRWDPKNVRPPAGTTATPGVTRQ
jgi:hypothetical protein